MNKRLPMGRLFSFPAIAQLANRRRFSSGIVRAPSNNAFLPLVPPGKSVSLPLKSPDSPHFFSAKPGTDILLVWTCSRRSQAILEILDGPRSSAHWVPPLIPRRYFLPSFLLAWMLRVLTFRTGHMQSIPGGCENFERYLWHVEKPWRSCRTFKGPRSVPARWKAADVSN